MQTGAMTIILKYNKDQNRHSVAVEATAEETKQRKGNVEPFTSINVPICSCRTYEKKPMQIIRGDYANSLLNEKKKLIGNRAQC